MSQKTPRRNVMRIELSDAAKELLGTLSDRHGMTQISLASRIFEWFAGLPAEAQTLALGHVSGELATNAARIALKKLG